MRQEKPLVAGFYILLASLTKTFSVSFQFFLHEVVKCLNVKNDF